MKTLETIAGFCLGLVTLLIMLGGASVAFGSIGRYMKIKSM